MSIGQPNTDSRTAPQGERAWIEMNPPLQGGRVRLVGLPTAFIADDELDYRTVKLAPWSDDF
jgi:hypothetical protein